jgi:hypothetical protein
MGVASLVARVATMRVHVFLVETPGRSLLRMNAQAAIATRGWVEATGPADADALLVCGHPDRELGELIDAVWEQIPSPRFRAIVVTGEPLTSVLDSIPAALQDDARQRTDIRTRRMRLDDDRGSNPAPAPTKDADMSDDGVRGADTSPGDGTSDGDASPDMKMSADEDMDMSSDGDMGMDMDMSGPAGIALAGGGDDRDGLEMDVTHLSLGPLLAGWPPDVVLHCTLHGDVVADARAERFSGTGSSEQPPEAARLLDDAARLLTVAGWEPVAQELARLRNDIFESTHPHLASRLRRVTVRVRRSRTLRWSLKSITTAKRIPVRDRLLEWLDTALAILENPAAPPAGHGAYPVPAATPEDVRLAVIGQEIAATRLIIAALGTQSTRTIADDAHE